MKNYLLLFLTSLVVLFSWQCNSQRNFEMKGLWVEQSTEERSILGPDSIKINEGFWIFDIQTKGKATVKRKNDPKGLEDSVVYYDMDIEDQIFVLGYNRFSIEKFTADTLVLKEKSSFGEKYYTKRVFVKEKQ